MAAPAMAPSTSSTSFLSSSSSPYSSSSNPASTSASSLWTASSASSSRLSLSLDANDSLPGVEDMDEQRCAELLQQLEQQRAEVEQRNAAHAKQVDGRREAAQQRERDVQRAQSGALARYTLSGAADASPLAGSSGTYRNAPRALANSASLASLASTIRPSSASIPSNRRSRRASFTQTDIADLDIDAILDAYTEYAPLEEPASRPSSRLARLDTSYSTFPSTPKRSVPRRKSSANLRNPNLRQDIFPSRSATSPSSMRAQRPSLTRSGTQHSTHSTKSTISTSSSADAAYNELFPHRRVSPFPTVPRKKSNTSLRSGRNSSGSMHSSFSLSQAPPVPSLPLPPTPSSPSIRSTRPSNRTFSSFARQSTCSTMSSHSFASTHSSTYSSPSLPSSPQLAFPRGSYASSSAASSSCGGSVRWSVVTSSTAPSSTAYSDAGDNCSRRGSVLYSPSLGVPPSPARRGSAPRFRLADEPTEEADEHTSDDEDGEDDPKDSGLISWTDFAAELEALPPPPKPSSTSAGPLAPRSRQSQQAQHPHPSSPAFLSTPPPLNPAKRQSPQKDSHRAQGLKSKLSLATLRVR
ncbi:hypothetical protein JCM10213_002155 [Rhodosporidiobolus nylandii]